MRFWRGLKAGLSKPARYLALLAGALPVLAFPALNLEWLAWFGLVPGLLLIRASPTRREAIVRAWWFGTGYLLVGQYWLAPNLGPALLLAAAVVGVLQVITGIAVWHLTRPPLTVRRALAAIAVVPSAWLLTEWIRSYQGLGGPWAVFGTSQWQHPVFLALAAVGGVWLLSFALVMANTGIVIALVGRGTAVRAVGAAAVLAAVLAGPLAFALTPPPPTTGHITLALVQPGTMPGSTGRQQGETLAAEEPLTAGPAKGADLIVWGETSVSYYLPRYPAILRKLERLSAADHAQILVNQDARNARGAVSKAAVLIGPGGIDGTYVKTRLVPFGEYIPFRSVLGWLAKISKAAPQNIVPGTGAHVLHARLPDGRRLTIGVLICFESAFPDMSRVDADQDARLMIYQTSDSTFQGTWAQPQHASLAAVRAAETGRPAVQAALTGDSAAFDARGRLIAWAGPSFRGVLRVSVGLPPGSSRTIYDDLGEWAPWTATGIVVLAALIGIGRSERTRRLRPGRPRPADEARNERNQDAADVSAVGVPAKKARAGGGLEAGDGAAASQAGSRQPEP